MSSAGLSRFAMPNVLTPDVVSAPTAKPTTVKNRAVTPTSATSHFWACASFSRYAAAIAMMPRPVCATFSLLSSQKKLPF